MWFRNILTRRARTTTTQPRRGVGRLASLRRNARGDSFLIDEAFLRRLERLNLQAQRTLQGNPASGEHPSRRQAPTSVYSDHRPYTPGDDYRHVDWNAYARQEQVLVKLGEMEQDVNVHVLLDCSRSMAWGAPPKLVVAQQLVAALGYLAISHSDRLRITPFGSALQQPFGPVQSKNRIMEMLNFVAAVQPGDRTALARVLTSYARMHERGGILVLCSDLLSEPAEGLAEGLRVFTPPRWQVLILHLIDQRELQPDFNGTLELEDAETGQHLELTIDHEVLASYRRNLREWQERLADTCARRGAAYAQILTDWPLEQSVIPYLRARQVLR